MPRATSKPKGETFLIFKDIIATRSRFQMTGLIIWLAKVIKRKSFDVSQLNAFYGIMPESFRIIGIVIATAAAIIASQALISGSFTLISEAMRLNLWPKFKIRYPSEERGQLYVPAINFLLYVGCVCLYFFQSRDNPTTLHRNHSDKNLLHISPSLLYF